MDIDVFPDKPLVFAVNAVSSKTSTVPIKAAFVDSKGAFVAGTRIDAFPSVGKYVATMMTNRNLAVGTHAGNLELRLCYDSPAICAQPVEGSPWQLPYKIRVVDPSVLSYKGWESFSTAGEPFGLSVLSYRDGKPLVVTQNFQTRALETWASTDVGKTWRKVATSHSPSSPERSNFALASDDAVVYLSGGKDVNTGTTPSTDRHLRDVWRFDGADWQLRTASAQFPAREQHVMAKVGSTLYVVGGYNFDKSTLPLRDVWKSTDDGVNWSKVLDQLPPALGAVTCALNWKGSLLLVGSTVATSADGVDWTLHSSGYPVMPPLGSDRCAVLNDRLFINVFSMDGYNNAMSSSDLATWQVEMPAFLGNVTPGMIAIDGRLLTVSSWGNHVVYRSIP